MNFVVTHFGRFAREGGDRVANHGRVRISDALATRNDRATTCLDLFTKIGEKSLDMV